jgi:hypothetical protein
MHKYWVTRHDSSSKTLSRNLFVPVPVLYRHIEKGGSFCTAVGKEGWVPRTLMADTVSSIQKVRDYITKYGIEEKLSEAVNQAIKQESTDPFRVISMYLAQFAEVPRVARPLALLDIAFSPHDRAHILARRLQMGRWQMRRPQQVRLSLRRMHRRPSQMRRRLRRLPSHEARQRALRG